MSNVAWMIVGNRWTPSWRVTIGAAAWGLATALFAAPAVAVEKVTYNDHVRPILQNNCFSCHNPDKQKAGLDLTAYRSLITGSSGGEVLVPESPEDSILYLVISHEEEPKMPPKGGKLPDDAIDTIRRWITGGLLESEGGKAMRAKSGGVSLVLGETPTGRPESPPPMPEDLLLEPQVVTTRPGAVKALAAAPWSPVLAIGAQRQVLLHHTETLALLGVLSFAEGFPHAVRFSRNGRLLLASGGRGGMSGCVVVWRLADGRRVIEIGDELDAVLAADITADQSQIALGGPSKLVKVFDTATGTLIRSIKKHTDWVTALAYSPDGVLLATGDRAGGLHVWEAYSGGAFYTLDGHGGQVTAMSWRDDGNVLATSSEDGTIRLWEMIEGRQAKKWNAHDGGVLSVQFSHDGRIVSAGRDRHVRLWDGDGKQQKVYESFEDLALAATVTEDGTRIFGADWTGSLRAWDADSGETIGSIATNPPSLEQRLAAAEMDVEAADQVLSKTRSGHGEALAGAAPARMAVEEAGQMVDASHAKAGTMRKAMEEANAAVKQMAEAHDQAVRRRDAAMQEKVTVEEQRARTQKQSQQTRDVMATASGQIERRRPVAERLVNAAGEAKDACDAHPEDEALAAVAKAALAVADEVTAVLSTSERTLVEAQVEMTSLGKTLAAVELLMPEKARNVETAEMKRSEAEKRMQEAATRLVGAQAAMAAAETNLKETEAELAICIEAAKPLNDRVEEMRQASETAEIAIQIARKQQRFWEAAVINLGRHAARGAMDQEIRKSADEAVTLASTVAAVEACKKQLADSRQTMAAAPKKVAVAKATVAKAVAATVAAKAEQVAKRAVVDHKIEARKAFENVVAAYVEEADQQGASTAMAEAVVLAQRASEALGRDIDTAREHVKTCDEAVKKAEQAVTVGETSVASAQQAMTAMPGVVARHQAALDDASRRYEAATARHAMAAAQLAEAKAAFDQITSQYRELLAASR